MSGKHVDHVITLVAIAIIERIRSCWISEGWDSSDSTMLPKEKSDLRNKMLQH